jgi:AcrR family transcriptional regulator
VEAATKGAASKERQLSGEKAQRIIDAMRDSVARRGAAGSTFEHVAREAGVSRGLLHYYFGTKERLLIEVVRRDSDLRIARLDEMLAEATTADAVLDVLVKSLTDLIDNDPGFFLLLYELFSAGRRNPDIQHEVGQLFERTRSHVAAVLRQKEAEGVLSLRFPADAVVSYLFAVGDGFALQSLSDPERDITDALAAGAASARYLLVSD